MNPYLVNLSILKVIGCSRDAQHCRHFSDWRKWKCNTETTCNILKTGGERQRSDDETSANAEFSGVGKEGTYCCSEINLCFLIFSCLIFESSVDRGIPSLAAAPSGPATLPLQSANAVSMISLS